MQRPFCTLSNSSMQTTPPSANTMAPPSIKKLREDGSLITEAVKPAALLPFPEVYTWERKGEKGRTECHIPQTSQGKYLNIAVNTQPAWQPEMMTAAWL